MYNLYELLQIYLTVERGQYFQTAQTYLLHHIKSDFDLVLLVQTLTYLCYIYRLLQRLYLHAFKHPNACDLSKRY